MPQPSPKPTTPKPEIKPPAQKPPPAQGCDLHKCELCNQYYTPENMAAYEWKNKKIVQIDPRENPWQCGLRWICSNCINTIQHDANQGILT